jgi:hypothetical protein
MGKKIDPKEAMKSPNVLVTGRLHGELKNRFIHDLERGYKQSELVREMANFFYQNRPKNSY